VVLSKREERETGFGLWIQHSRDEFPFVGFSLLGSLCALSYLSCRRRYNDGRDESPCFGSFLQYYISSSSSVSRRRGFDITGTGLLHTLIWPSVVFLGPAHTCALAFFFLTFVFGVCL
jgi:hypothetical protein